MKFVNGLVVNAANLPTYGLKLLFYFRIVFVVLDELEVAVD